MRTALAAEWTKLRTVPDAAVALVLIVVLTVGLSVAASTATTPDAVHSSLLGVQAGQAVVAVWAVQSLAGEFGTGLILATFTALPRRMSVLAAKAVLLVAGVLVAGTLSVVVSVLAGRGLIAGYPSLATATVLRAAGGSVLYLCLIALLALGVAAAVRSAVGAAGVVLGLLYLVPTMLNLFHNPDWQRMIYKIAPSTAGLTVLSTVDVGSLSIGPLAGLGVAAAWAFGLLGAGALMLAARDV